MKIIKLTGSVSLEPIYINPHYIKSMNRQEAYCTDNPLFKTSEHPARTAVYMLGEEGYPTYTQETPEEIIKLITE